MIEHHGIYRRTRKLAGILWRFGRKHIRKWKGTKEYWESRYNKKGNSGSGSYGQLAEYKAQVLNSWVVENKVGSIIEFGCGDGNQLGLSRYPSYIGLDISLRAVEICSAKFRNDTTKSFFLYHPNGFVDSCEIFRAEMSLSLDVIYHIIEDDIFDKYMAQLFESATRYIIIYSSDYDSKQNMHERRRCFTKWVERNKSDWKLERKIKNPYPYDPLRPSETSLCDFYIFKKNSISAITNKRGTNDSEITERPEGERGNGGCGTEPEVQKKKRFCGHS